ncbi:MAG: class I SAM-dependent methyltransferase [Micromonosporaceae bacterium]
MTDVRPWPPNPKAEAWDLLGGAYWNADYDGGPSDAGCRQYLAGLEAGASVLLIGASTARLARAALACGLELTVCDFSPVMLADLRSALGDRASYLLADVTRTGALAAARFRSVLADRLLNRFTVTELNVALTEVIGALRVGGEARLSYRLGLYARDLPVIDAARRHGCLEAVFDESTFDIDYSGGLDWLADVLPPHGSLDPATVVKFYAARGREHRLRPGELDEIMRGICAERDLGIEVGHTDLPETPADHLLTLLRTR